MRIGELAALLGVSTRTVRHYHQQGVLPEPPRRANGYRDYGMRDAVALARVRRLVQLGLSLDEAREVIAEDRSRELTEILTEIDADLARQEREIRERRAKLADLLRRAGPLGPDDVASPDLLMLLRAVSLPESKAAAWDRELLMLMDSVAAEPGRRRALAQLESLAADPEAAAVGHEFYRRLDELADAEPGDRRIAPLARELAGYSREHLLAGSGPATRGWDPALLEPFLDGLAPAQAEAVRQAVEIITTGIRTDAGTSATTG
ncbi:MerR family transcriptional regulator [Nonomuraea sp. KC401]|uniref:MerR family transcriptional regulator n=1 Tax=unclassified Nonomuraea TaxID=2593643 RepID=UPI0010FE82F5|nr:MULTISPECIES: MerR family transcriptional regulator [unclassified Nonomuraea]NBE96866.1 MerR family transcriptional regulator [Nonomuraea sp. K271]TLF66469.1 MerR family transcriptional regulator [Nonomuraea sp. KC401]